MELAPQKLFSASVATFFKARWSSHLVIMTHHDHSDIPIRMTNTPLPT